MDLRAEPGLRAALAVARAWGVRPSLFLGVPVVDEITVYEYDDTGRLMRSTTRREAWTEYDREAALALADLEADECSGCGGDLAETTKRENEYAYVLDREGLRRCHRCTGREIAGKPYEDSHQPGALLLPLKLDEGVVAANRARIEEQEEAERGRHRSEAGAGGPGEPVEAPEGGGGT